MLAKLAASKGLPRYVRMTPAFAEMGMETKVAEDVFEAFTGALYMSHGLLATKRWLLGIFEAIDINAVIRDNSNYKEYAMLKLHQLKLPLPTYTTISAPASRLNPAGPPSTQDFSVTATIRGVQDMKHLIGRGTGPTKREAEQEAARELLYLLGGAPPTSLV